MYILAPIKHVVTPFLSFVCKTGGARRFSRIALTGLLVLGAAVSSDAAPAVKHVLFLQSFNRGVLTLDYLSGSLRIDLDQGLGESVNIAEVVVSPGGPNGAPEQTVVDYLRAAYPTGSKPDLIVTFGGPATDFARRHRRQLFPDTPLLFAGVDDRFLRDAPREENETVVAVNNDFPKLVDEILQVRPETRQVFMVMGSGPLSEFWRREFDTEFGRFRNRLTFIWSDRLSRAEILRRCAELPRDSAILYFALGTDAMGGMHSDERVFADLLEDATAPLFGTQSAMLGHGIVGGTLLSNEQSSRNVADAAIRLLDGAAPASVTVPVQLPGPTIFDGKMLEKWDISESRLPSGSRVINRQPTLWSQHKSTVLSAAGVLVVQALLIVGLVYQRRARQRAEVESRRNLALAADAGRRETMSALTGSIAHELGQPLRSMIYNAQALQMMVTRNRATPDTIGEVLSDIQAQGQQATQIIERHRTMLRSRDLEKKPTDLHLVINESLALVAHDMDARQVTATVHLSSTPCVVSGDQVLLQQVLVNLVMNAMDAMADTPPYRRHLTITSDVRAADVEVTVRDNGTGVPQDVVNKLFTPFMTTKSHGLGIGLTIVRTILDAHGGTIAARNNPEGGASFVVTLPRSDATRARPGSRRQHDVVAHTSAPTSS
jgi:signal transduction histidine kinase